MRWLPKRFPEWKWNVQAQGTPIVATWLQGGCPIGRSPFLLPPYKWPRNWSPDRSMFLDLLLGRWSSQIGVGWPLLGGIRPNPNTFSAALNETRSRVNFLNCASWTWMILFDWLIHWIRSCKDPKAHVKDISESWREAGLVVSFVHCFSEVSQREGAAWDTVNLCHYFGIFRPATLVCVFVSSTEMGMAGKAAGLKSIRVVEQPPAASRGVSRSLQWGRLTLTEKLNWAMACPLMARGHQCQDEKDNRDVPSIHLGTLPTPKNQYFWKMAAWRLTNGIRQRRHW